jgi:hypothetical protein
MEGVLGYKMKIIFRLGIMVLCFALGGNQLRSQWVQTNGASGPVVRGFAVAGTNLYAATTAGVYLSTNNGVTWSAVNTGLANTNVTSVAGAGTNIFAGTTTGVFLSTTNGLSWNPVDSGLVNTSIRALAVSGLNLFAGTQGGVFVSSVNGSSWKATNGVSNINALAVSGSRIIAALDGSIVSTSNNGATWETMIAGISQSVNVLAVSGNDLFAGTPAGVYGTRIDVPSWSLVGTGLQNISVSSVAVSGTKLFAGTTNGVYLSAVNGSNWATANTLLPKIAITSLIVYGTNLIAGSNGEGIWKRPLSEMATSVDDASIGLPAQYALEQNYPNPFNPVTTVHYALPLQTHVSLIVFDMLGRRVAVPVDEVRAAGPHSAVVDMSALPSGVYFYRLTAGTYTATKKLTLIR